MLRRSFILLAAVVTVSSCATVNSETTVRETRIREWMETEKSGPSVRFEAAFADDKTVTGHVEEFKTCRDFSKEENSRVALIRNKPRRLWLPILGAVATGSLGAYLLASAHNRSDKPGTNDDGEETMSPKTASFVFGGISVGAATGFLGYSTGIAIRSIDREKPLDNETRVADESNPYDCEVGGLGNASVKVSSPRLGIDHPVEVTKTSDTGELEFTLTNVPGFMFPIDDDTTVTLTLYVEGTEAEVPVDDWVFAPLDGVKTSCTAFDSCVEKHNTLGKEKNPREMKIRNFVKSRLVALAQNSEETCRKFEKTFAGSDEFGNMEDIRDVCDLFAVQKQNSLLAIREFLKKKRSDRTRSAAEQLAYDIISRSPALADCRWFEGNFPNSRYLGAVRDYALSLEYEGVSAALLKCCGNGNLKVVDVLRNEKKGWSESLAVEQVMQSSSSFRVFNSDEIEQLRRAGARDSVIQAMMRKAGQVMDEMKRNTRDADYTRREAERSNGEIQRCIVGCEKDFGECADRRNRGLFDALIFDTTRCKSMFDRCYKACKE